MSYGGASNSGGLSILFLIKFGFLFLYNKFMGKFSCGLVYFLAAVFIGWYLWFRDGGKDEIREVIEDDLGLKVNSRSDESQAEYQKWWDGLTAEEQEEILNATRDPLGREKQQES